MENHFHLNGDGRAWTAALPLEALSPPNRAPHPDAPHATDAPSARAARPGDGEGHRDGTKSASRPNSPVTRAAQGARVRPAIAGEVGTRVPTLPSPHGYPFICSPRSPAGGTPASASGSPGGHMTRGAESGAGRHVTACGRRLMTPEPALAASATGEGS